MSRQMGFNLTPVLEEIHDTLWEIDSRETQEPYEFGDTALRSSLKILMSVTMDKLWAKQELENTPLKEREQQAMALGEDFRKLIKNHLDIDTHKLYEKEKQT